MLRCGAAVLLSCCAIGGCASYQSSHLECGGAGTVDQRSTEQEGRLVPGCIVRILTRHGELLEGRYMGGDADSLSLARGGSVEYETGWSEVDLLGGARRVACRDVVEIRVREHNTAGSVTIGVLSGLVLLAVVFVNVFGRGLSY